MIYSACKQLIVSAGWFSLSLTAICIIVILEETVKKTLLRKYLKIFNHI